MENLRPLQVTLLTVEVQDWTHHVVSSTQWLPKRNCRAWFPDLRSPLRCGETSAIGRLTAVGDWQTRREFPPLKQVACDWHQKCLLFNLVLSCMPSQLTNTNWKRVALRQCFRTFKGRKPTLKLLIARCSQSSPAFKSLYLSKLRKYA